MRSSFVGGSIIISRSNLPGLRIAGSKSFGLFVAPINIRGYATFESFTPSSKESKWVTILDSNFDPVLLLIAIASFNINRIEKFCVRIHQ